MSIAITSGPNYEEVIANEEWTNWITSSSITHGRERERLVINCA